MWIRRASARPYDATAGRPAVLNRPACVKVRASDPGFGARRFSILLPARLNGNGTSSLASVVLGGGKNLFYVEFFRFRTRAYAKRQPDGTRESILYRSASCETNNRLENVYTDT